MSWAPWQLGLRLAWRDIAANRWRSVLVVALIGLPVLLVGALAIGYRTYDLDAGQRLARTIGTADLAVRWSGVDGTVRQGVGGWIGDGGAGVEVSGSVAGATPTDAGLRSLLPAGSRLIPYREATRVLRTDLGYQTAQLVGLDLQDPLGRGIATVTAGRAPRTAGEVAVSEALAAPAGPSPGARRGVATTSDGDSSAANRYRVVGVVADGQLHSLRAVYALPAALAPSATEVGSESAALGWLVDTPAPVSWATVAELNRHGFAAISRAEYLHPSAAARAAQAAQTSTGSDVTTLVAPLAIVVGMALLEVVLLAGPAFAVGAKRRRRDLALLAAVGGAPRDLRRAVLASAVMLGLLAGLIGAAGSVAVAAVGEPLLAPHVDTRPGDFAVPVWQLLALVVVAVGTAVLASLIPARAAGRTDVVAALAGRRGESSVRRAVPVLGLVLAGLGTLLAFTLGTRVGSDATIGILGGIALVEVGLVACMPAVLALVARVAHRLPLTPRLALRDAGRNRSAAAPAIAAVMAAVIGATAALLGLTAQSDRSARQYGAALPANSLSVDLGSTPAASYPGIAAALRATLPVQDPIVVDTDRGDQAGPAAAPSSTVSLGVVDPGDTGDTDRRIDGQLVQFTLIATPSQVETLFGGPQPTVAAALRSGYAVVTAARLVHDGRTQLQVSDSRSQDSTPRVVSVPAIAVTSGYVPADLVVPPQLARRLGVTPAPTLLFARTSRTPSDAEVARADGELRKVVVGAGTLYVERGYRDRYATLRVTFVLVAAALAVLGAVIATALANADGRSELQTLGAVGATPGVRRRLSASRAGVIASIGTGAGVLAGVLVPYALVVQSRQGTQAQDQLRFLVPWPSLLTLVFAVPAAATVIGALLTRSRLPTGAPG